MPEVRYVLERRRKVRLGTVWIGLAVLVGGNVADWFGWIGWGPEQTDPAQRYWVLASACGFWIAAASLLTLVVDSWFQLRKQPSTPTYRELPGGGPLRRFANSVRALAEKYHALIGAGGLVGGAVLGHFIWKP